MKAPLLALAALLSGCLTLSRRDSQPVRVNDLPPDTRIFPLEDDLWLARQVAFAAAQPPVEDPDDEAPANAGLLLEDPVALQADAQGRLRAERRVSGRGEVWVDGQARAGFTWPDRYYLFSAPEQCPGVLRFEGRVTAPTTTLLVLESLLLVPVLVDAFHPEKMFSLRPRQQASPLRPCAQPTRMPDLTTVHITAKGPAKIGLLADMDMMSTGTGSVTTYRYQVLGEAPLDLQIPLGQTPQLWVWRGRRMNSTFFHGERLRVNSNGQEQHIELRAPRGVLGDLSVYGISFGLSSVLTAGLLKLSGEPGWRPWAWGGAGLTALGAVGVTFSTAKVKNGAGPGAYAETLIDE